MFSFKTVQVLELKEELLKGLLKLYPAPQKKPSQTKPTNKQTKNQRTLPRKTWINTKVNLFFGFKKKSKTDGSKRNWEELLLKPQIFSGLKKLLLCNSHEIHIHEKFVQISRNTVKGQCSTRCTVPHTGLLGLCISSPSYLL